MNHARHAQPPNSSGPSFLCLYWQLKSTYRSAENHHRPVARLEYVPAREKALLSISAMLVVPLPLRRYLLDLFQTGFLVTIMHDRTSR